MGTEYSPKNILITGGAGFIGSHVVSLLVNKYPDYKIVNYDKLDYCSSLKNIASLQSKPNYRFVEGNILSAELVSFILEEEQIDTIVHFAAQTHVDNSFGNSFQFTETNVLGTHVLLEAAKLAGIKRFIHVSTDEVKGENEQIGADNILEPTNPYAASKAGAELVVRSYHRSFNLPVIITRSNNVYGPHQFPEKIIPKFISLLRRGRKCFIHGSGSNKRNYIFAGDVAAAFDEIIHRGVVGKVYSIGSEDCYSNLDVARRLLKAFGLEDQESEYLEYVEDRMFNDLRYWIDGSEMQKLGWKPEVLFEEGLAKTIEWYQHPDHWNNWIASVDSALVAHPRVGQNL